MPDFMLRFNTTVLTSHLWQGKKDSSSRGPQSVLLLAQERNQLCLTTFKACSQSDQF